MEIFLIIVRIGWLGMANIWRGMKPARRVWKAVCLVLIFDLLKDRITYCSRSAGKFVEKKYSY